MKMTTKQYKTMMAKKGRDVTVPASKKPAITFKGYIMRSKWEAQYAYHLETLRSNGKILVWDYEPERFILGANCSYLPDFRVVTNDWELVYIEVKGYARAAGMVKWKTAAANNLHAMFLMVRMRGQSPVLMNIAPHREMSVTPEMFGASE